MIAEIARIERRTMTAFGWCDVFAASRPSGIWLNNSPKSPKVATLRGASASFEHHGAHDRAAAEKVDAVFFTRAVAQAALVDERGRATSVQVERFGGAEAGHGVGQLGHRHAAVPLGAAVARHG